MTDPKTYKFNTKTLHSGHQPDKNFGSRAVPIYQTTSYLFQDADHAAALFNLEEGGHIYSRISNPTVAVLEERVAALWRFRYLGYCLRHECYDVISFNNL